jgi:hypothetical protein
MSSGHYKPNAPAHGNHAANFDRALENALSQWQGNRDETFQVTKFMTVSANPGGVKEYIVTIQPAQPPGSGGGNG